MNKDQALSFIPDDLSLLSMPSFEKRIVAENIIENIIFQIELENRNPTNWEKETLSYAFGLIISGLYVAAIKEAMFCFSGKDEVARPEHWWDESKNLTSQDLRIRLAYVLGAPLR